MKDYQHIQRIFTNPIYVHFKKHFCPTCNEQLRTIKVSEIVNSNSTESKKFDFHTLDNYMIGNVKFIWTEFFCSKCQNQFNINAIKQIERELISYEK